MIRGMQWKHVDQVTSGSWSTGDQQLLDPYNASADALRPIVAQIFNVPELAGSQRTEIATTRTSESGRGTSVPSTV